LQNTIACAAAAAVDGKPVEMLTACAAVPAVTAVGDKHAKMTLTAESTL
jgi:hypothetical protein